MTPRERVKLAMEHQQADRVPIGYAATPEADIKLKKYLSIDDNLELLNRLGVDYRTVTPGYKGPRGMLYDLCWDIPGRDIWGVERKNVSTSYSNYREIYMQPLKDIKDISELESYPWPKIEWVDFGSLKDQIDRLEKEDEYWIVLSTMAGSVFDMSWYMRGMEQFMVDLLLNPEIAREMISKLSDFTIQVIEGAVEASGGRIDMVLLADDIASQEGMLISLDTWRKMIMPWHKGFCSKAHSLDTKTLFHSCGSIGPIIDDLIVIGMDAINPLQFSAKGFPTPEELKGKYGDRLSFLGGMDIQTILPFYSAEEIKKETLRLIKILGKDGGFILQSTHNIQADTPPENIIAMYDAALDYKF